MERRRMMEAGEPTGDNDVCVPQRRKSRKSSKKKNNSHNNNSSSRSRHDSTNSTISRYGTPSEELIAANSNTNKSRRRKGKKNGPPKSSSVYQHQQHHHRLPTPPPPPPPARTPKPPSSYQQRHFVESRDDKNQKEEQDKDEEETNSNRTSSRRRKWWGGSNLSNTANNNTSSKYYNHPRHRCETMETRYSSARETIASEDPSTITYQRKFVRATSREEDDGGGRGGRGSTYYDANDEIYTFKNTYMNGRSSSRNVSASSIPHNPSSKEMEDYISPTVDPSFEHSRTFWTEQYPTPPQLSQAHWNLQSASSFNKHLEKHRHLYTASTIATTHLHTASSTHYSSNDVLHDIEREGEQHCDEDDSNGMYAGSSPSPKYNNDVLLATPATPAESIWHHVRKIFTGTFSFCSPMEEKRQIKNDNDDIREEEEEEEEEYFKHYQKHHYQKNFLNCYHDTSRISNTSSNRSSSGNNKLVGHELLESNHSMEDKFLEYSDMEEDYDECDYTDGGDQTEEEDDQTEEEEEKEDHEEDHEEDNNDNSSSVFFGGDDRTGSYYDHEDQDDGNSTLCSHASILSHNSHPLIASSPPAAAASSSGPKNGKTVEIAFMDETNGAIDPHFFRASILRDPALLMGCRYSGWDGKRSHYTAMVPLSTFSPDNNNTGSNIKNKRASSTALTPFKTPESTGDDSSVPNANTTTPRPPPLNGGAVTTTPTTATLIKDEDGNWKSPDASAQQQGGGKLKESASAVVHIIPSPSAAAPVAAHSSSSNIAMQQTISGATTTTQSQQRQQPQQQPPRRTHRKQQSSISEMTDHNYSISIIRTNESYENGTATTQSPASIFIPPNDSSDSAVGCLPPPPHHHSKDNNTIQEFLSSSEEEDDEDEGGDDGEEVTTNTQSSQLKVLQQLSPLPPHQLSPLPPHHQGLGRPPLIKNRGESIGSNFPSLPLSSRNYQQQPPLPLPPNRARANTGNTASSGITNGSYHRRTDSTVFFSPDMLSLISDDDYGNNNNNNNNNNRYNKSINRNTISPKQQQQQQSKNISPIPPPVMPSLGQSSKPPQPQTCTTPYHKRQKSHTSISQTITVVKLNHQEEDDVSPIHDDVVSPYVVQSENNNKKDDFNNDQSDDYDDDDDEYLSPFMKQRKGYVVKREDGVECTPIRRSNGTSSRSSTSGESSNEARIVDTRSSDDEEEEEEEEEVKEDEVRKHFFPRPNQKNGVNINLFGAGGRGGEDDERTEKKQQVVDPWLYGSSRSHMMFSKTSKGKEKHMQHNAYVRSNSLRDRKSAKKKKESSLSSSSFLHTKSSKSARKRLDRNNSSSSQQPKTDEVDEHFLPHCSAFVKELLSSGRTGKCILEGWVAFSKGTKLIETLQQQQQTKQQQRKINEEDGDDDDDDDDAPVGLERNDFRYVTILDDGPYLHLFSTRKKNKSNNNNSRDYSGDNNSGGMSSKVMTIDLSEGISIETRLVSKKHGRCIVLIDHMNNNRIICTLLPVSLDPAFFRDKSRARLVSDRKFESIRHKIFLTPPPPSHGDHRTRTDSHVVRHSQKKKNNKLNGKGGIIGGGGGGVGGEWGDPNFVNECFAPVAQLESVMYVLFAIDGAMKFRCSLVWN